MAPCALLTDCKMGSLGHRAYRASFCPSSRPLCAHPLRKLSATQCTCSQNHDKTTSDVVTQLHKGASLGSLAAAACLLLPGAALATDTAALQEAASDVLASVQKEQSAYNFFVTLAFTTVVALLATVTLGVAYLTIVQFLDKRQELEDQGQLKTSITGLPADKEVSKDSSEGEKRLSLRKAMSVKKDTSKGFGAGQEQRAQRAICEADPVDRGDRQQQLRWMARGDLDKRSSNVGCKKRGFPPMQGPEYQPGCKVNCCASFDGQLRECSRDFQFSVRSWLTSAWELSTDPAEVLEKKSEKQGAVLFYVHYLDCDKRLDEWVTVDKLHQWTTTPRAPAARSDTAPALQGNGELLSPTALGDVKVTRRFKRKFEEIHHVVDDHGHAGEHGHEKEAHVPKVKNINVIELGRWEMDTWYHSPYPEPYASQDKLYVCEFSLKYFRKKKTLIRHLAKLDIRHPPGDEIYRSPPPPPSQPSYAGGAVTNPPISVFEVDGKKAKVYCQNLCLLSKLFLDHKTLYYDVDPFLFYVLCERDTDGYHIVGEAGVGYFSKEKECKEEYNLACILTLPAYQRKGYGKLLIAFAYELSRREGRVGTPERPLSDLGQVSFRSYWARVLLEALRHMRGDVSVKEMSEMTMIKGQDIVDTLQPITCSLARRIMPQSLGLIKYWRGTHLIHADPRIVQEHYAKHAQQRMIDVDPACLHWQPLPALNNRKRP
ncbi:hypothetical protein QJQ45_019840 [Haematococcus lacustris]|nr:hypothetical protein QJQ45_019840 [Haematococcus lacustris]